MTDQGFSLFQGMPSIQVANNSVDEEEEEQDRRRRNEEIQNGLERIFEDDTADESEHFSQDVVYRREINQGPWQRDECIFPVAGDMGRQDDGDNDQMQRMLKIKTQEACELKKSLANLANEKKSHEMEIRKLEKQLAVACAENERARMTQTQSNDLLIESKAKCSELNSTVARHQAKIQELQQKNADMLVEMDRTNRTLQDSEMERRKVEGNALRQREILRDMERKDAEVGKLQEQVNCLQKKVDDRDHDLRTMEKRYKELERNREVLLVDKTDTINDLMRTLGETQAQCNDLLSRPDLKHENFQLKQHIGALEKQAEEMQKRIDGLTAHLHAASQERNLMETLVDGSPINFNSKLPSSTPMPMDAKHHTIQDELNRSLGALKEKREQVRKLQEEVRSKEMEIESLKESYSDSLIKIGEYEEKLTKLTQKLRIYENASEDTGRNHEGSEDLREMTCKSCGELSELSQTAQTLLRESQVEIEHLKNEYCSLSSAKNELVREINELKSQDFVKQLECLQKECESLKETLVDREDTLREKEKLIEKQRWEHEKELAQLKEKHEKDKLESITKRRSLRNDSRDCSNCLNQMTDITRQEIANIQLQKDCANYLREINHLKAELKESADTMNDLHARLGLKEEQNRVIADLKEQAAKFGEYIKNCSATSTPQKVDSRDASVSTSPDMEAYSRDPGLFDQYAKAYAEEIKKLETEHREKEVRAQETIRKLSAYRNEMQKVFEEKAQMFRDVMLSERKEYEKVISAREAEMEQSTEEHNKIVSKYKLDLMRLRQQIEELQVMVRELRRQNETEKNAVMELMTEWNLEKDTVKRHEGEMQRLIEETAKKYDEAKQTAKSYKKYAEQQDAHMQKEYSRIKESYETYRVKFEKRLDDLKRNYEKTLEEKVAKIEEEYLRKLEMLNKT